MLGKDLAYFKSIIHKQRGVDYGFFMIKQVMYTIVVIFI